MKINFIFLAIFKEQSQLASCNTKFSVAQHFVSVSLDDFSFLGNIQKSEDLLIGKRVRMKPEPTTSPSLTEIGSKLLSLYQTNEELQKLRDSQLENKLQTVTAELEDTKKKLRKANERYCRAVIELKHAKQSIQEKNEEISKMEDFILSIETFRDSSKTNSDASANNVRVIHSAGPASHQSRDLSPIPEENPDEIPDYFDVW